jgi:hypothetical protein
MKARVARVEEEEKRRVAKEKDEKRPQEGRMRKLAKELGLTPPPVELTPLVGVTPPTPTGVARPMHIVEENNNTPHTGSATERDGKGAHLHRLHQQAVQGPHVFSGIGN